MSTSAARQPSVRTPSGLFAYASFAIVVGGWVLFAVALVASQQTLDDVWTSVRDLPLVVEGVVWLLGFRLVLASSAASSPGRVSEQDGASAQAPRSGLRQRNPG